MKRDVCTITKDTQKENLRWILHGRCVGLSGTLLLLPEKPWSDIGLLRYPLFHCEYTSCAVLLHDSYVSPLLFIPL